MDMAAEQEAIRTCRQGRKDAFRPLVEEYFARCVRVARAMVGDAEEAKDLVQEAFVAAYQALPQFELGRPFYPWLRGILLNRCRAYLRARGRAARRRARAAERPGHWAIGVADSRGAAGRRTVDLVERALAELSDDDRELLVLKHMEGHTYDEIGEELGIGRGTVASRLYRARSRMRDVLTRLDPTLLDPEEDGGGGAATDGGDAAAEER